MPTTGFKAGFFLEQQVTRYEQEFIPVVYPERWGHMGYYHQARATLAIGERKIIAAQIDSIGRAAIHTGRATDVPLVNFGIAPLEYNTRVISIRAEWDIIKDLAAMEVANNSGLLGRRDIVAESLTAMENKLAERENELVIFGDRTEGMAGLLSGDTEGVYSINVTAGTNLHEMEALTLFNLFRGYGKVFLKRSMLTAKAAILLVTVDIYDALCQKFADSEGSPLDRLVKKEGGGYFREIIPINELSSDLLEKYGVNPAGTDRDRAMIVENHASDSIGSGIFFDSAVSREFFSVERTPVRQCGDTTYSVTSYCGTSEIKFKKPWCVMYINYDKFV